ncbi:hypothetical protein NMY22_g306 [Coprinellus aureogranulatus]|nr:hypothetical protein NMY22_g306 [Coprinellus aureogranulatus]
MSFSPVQLVAVGVGALFLWRIFRRFLVKDPLAVIPGPPSSSLLLGDITKFFDSNAWGLRDELSKRYGRFYTLKGLLQETHLVVSDPKALYHILIKDQDIFEESSDSIRVNSAVFGQGLLSTLGEQHRKQRKILNPVFSAAHMREITPIFHGVVDRLDKSMTELVTQGVDEASEDQRQHPYTANRDVQIDLLSWMTRTALELVAQSGFGYSFDTLKTEAREHPFAASLRDFMATVNDPLVLFARLSIFPYVFKLGTPRIQRAVVNALPWKRLHYLRDMVDVMHETSIDIFEKAKQRLDEEKGDSEGRAKSKDIMSALIKANRNASVEDRLTDEELTAQVSTLTFAAMDTTSNAMSRILHLLSQHPEVQQKLREEVTEAYANFGGDLDYDALNSLAILDAICRETLRLHASAPYLSRQATKDAVLPVGAPITTIDGREVNEVLVPKDTQVFISVHACNRDPGIWGPDAAEWKPERWMSPLPASVTEARVPGVYSHLMTFLGGGRACIGFKFSQLEMSMCQVVISRLIMKYRFEPSGKSIKWLYNGIVQPTVEEDKRTGPGGDPELSLCRDACAPERAVIISLSSRRFLTNRF